MSCKCVIITATASSDGKTTVNWRSPAIPGLSQFLITATQGGEVKNFDAPATATSAILDLAAESKCMLTVTPKDSSGPLNEMASAATPVPFPPKPVDPDAGRPSTLRVCADMTAGSVTVDWLASSVEYLEGYVVTIIDGTSSLSNFYAPGGDALSATFGYKIDPAKNYAIIVTPYDDLGVVTGSAAYPVSFPYPSPQPTLRSALTSPVDLAFKLEPALTNLEVD